MNAAVWASLGVVLAAACLVMAGVEMGKERRA
jgi:hypothetical protein